MTTSYYYSGDFITKEWKEKMEEKCFDGAYLDPEIVLPWMGQDPPVDPKKGCPGNLGNKLEVKGQGFEFKDGVVAAAGVVDGFMVYNCPDSTHFAIYEGGKLKLRDDGPWLDNGELVDEGVEALFCASPAFDEEGNLTGYGFLLKFEGSFDKFDEDQFEQVGYEFVAYYDGLPEQKLESDGSFEEIKDFGPQLKTDIKIIEYPLSVPE